MGKITSSSSGVGQGASVSSVEKTNKVLDRKIMLCITFALLSLIATGLLVSNAFQSLGEVGLEVRLLTSAAALIFGIAAIKYQSQKSITPAPTPAVTVTPPPIQAPATDSGPPPPTSVSTPTAVSTPTPGQDNSVILDSDVSRIISFILSPPPQSASTSSSPPSNLGVARPPLTEDMDAPVPPTPSRTTSILPNCSRTSFHLAKTGPLQDATWLARQYASNPVSRATAGQPVTAAAEPSIDPALVAHLNPSGGSSSSSTSSSSRAPSKRTGTPSSSPMVTIRPQASVSTSSSQAGILLPLPQPPQ